MMEKIFCQLLTSKFSGHCFDFFVIAVTKLGDLEGLMLV